MTRPGLTASASSSGFDQIASMLSMFRRPPPRRARAHRGSRAENHPHRGSSRTRPGAKLFGSPRHVVAPRGDDPGRVGFRIERRAEHQYRRDRMQAEFERRDDAEIPPPPRSAQNSSGWHPSSACKSRPSAVTMSTEHCRHTVRRSGAASRSRRTTLARQPLSSTRRQPASRARARSIGTRPLTRGRIPAVVLSYNSSHYHTDD
jgi:hypothetical protein